MFERLLQGMAKLSIARPRMILLVAVLLAAVGVIGISRIRNNTDLVRFFKTSAPLYRDTMFIDRNLAGVNSLEFMLSRKDGKPLTSLEDLSRMEAFKEMTLQQKYVSGTYSVVDMVEQIHRAETGRKGPLPPYSQEELDHYFGLMHLAGDKGLLKRFVKEDFTKARISTHVHAIGTSTAEPLVREILNEGKKIFGEAYSLVPTGGFYQVVQDSTKLVLSQVKSFSLSLVMVILAILVLFRSFKLTLVALIPNLIPIVWTGGLMGYLGIDLSAGTAMIASVVIGLAVDDTIHYLVCYRREYCIDSVQAVKQTTTGIGRALSITSFVLVLGFWVGSFGSFKPTIYFSLLTGITMLGAWICDLLVLPACLILIDPTRKKAAILTGSKA
jgi:hypothetical protein